MMFRPLFVSFLALVAFVGLSSRAWAKKTHPTTTPTTQETKDDDTDKDKPKAKSKSGDEDVETHNARAKEFSSGKDLDKAKTHDKLDKLTDQVNDLEKKVRNSGKQPDADPPPKHKKGKGATTEEAPTTQ